MMHSKAQRRAADAVAPPEAADFQLQALLAKAMRTAGMCIPNF